MAIVEDEVRNDSSEENDIEVVVEEYEAEQDSEDSDDDDDAVDEALERKVAEIEERIKEDPYNYDEHIELIQALWGLSELERWRAAFDRLQQMTALKPEHWLMRLQTEATLSHSTAKENRDEIANLFRQALLDCYSIQILSEWCSWSLTGSEPAHARAQLDEVLARAGADPLSGKVFWDAKLEFEKAQLDNMSEGDEQYAAQRERVLFCLEEAAARPLLRAAACQPLLDLALLLRGQDYVDKVTKQHNAALDYLEKITPFEDKLLTLENVEDKLKVYQEYIDTVKELATEDKYKECDSEGILKVVYERASTECASCADSHALLVAFAARVRARGSRASYWRALLACARRAPARHTFWTLQMQQLEHEGGAESPAGDTVKGVLERALARGMESYKEGEALWLSYAEHARRATDFSDAAQVQLLRSTFRLAWDSLADVWGAEANDCELPLYWARLEYQRMKDPKQGRDIFEEIFKYGDNKTMSKYWEALIHLEMGRSPAISERKLRELFRRALRCVADYPPAVARVWTDYERDHGRLHSLVECRDTCEIKLKEWRDNYQAMKDKMTGKKQKPKKLAGKKTKFDKKRKQTDEEPKKQAKGKRKQEDSGEGGGAKRKREKSADTAEKNKEENKGGAKRSHDDGASGSGEESSGKRARRGEAGPAARDACTLFVSNLEYKVDEQQLRAALAQFGTVVALRVRSGVKSFGGSIAYCQYSNQEAVAEALQHDRQPLGGRPMFLARYSANKPQPQFKYATAAEAHKLFVRNLPYARCSGAALRALFRPYGALRDVRPVTFKDGKPKGLAYIEYEDAAAAARAMESTNGMLVGERRIEVAVSAPPPRAAPAPAPALGALKRDGSGGMRRTQLSSFIPSVLQRPSTSRSNGEHVAQAPSTSRSNGEHAAQAPSTSRSNGEHEAQAPSTSRSNGEQAADHAADKRHMTNKDFRSMLLGDK